MSKHKNTRVKRDTKHKQHKIRQLTWAGMVAGKEYINQVRRSFAATSRWKNATELNNRILAGDIQFYGRSDLLNAAALDHNAKIAISTYVWERLVRIQGHDNVLGEGFERRIDGDAWVRNAKKWCADDSNILGLRQTSVTPKMFAAVQNLHSETQSSPKTEDAVWGILAEMNRLPNWGRRSIRGRKRKGLASDSNGTSQWAVKKRLLRQRNSVYRLAGHDLKNDRILNNAVRRTDSTRMDDENEFIKTTVYHNDSDNAEMVIEYRDGVQSGAQAQRAAKIEGAPRRNVKAEDQARGSTYDAYCLRADIYSAESYLRGFALDTWLDEQVRAYLDIRVLETIADYTRLAFAVVSFEGSGVHHRKYKDANTEFLPEGEKYPLAIPATHFSQPSGNKTRDDTKYNKIVHETVTETVRAAVRQNLGPPTAIICLEYNGGQGTGETKSWKPTNTLHIGDHTYQLKHVGKTGAETSKTNLQDVSIYINTNVDPELEITIQEASVTYDNKTITIPMVTYKSHNNKTVAEGFVHIPNKLKLSGQNSYGGLGKVTSRKNQIEIIKDYQRLIADAESDLNKGKSNTENRIQVIRLTGDTNLYDDGSNGMVATPTCGVHLVSDIGKRKRTLTNVNMRLNHSGNKQVTKFMRSCTNPLPFGLDLRDIYKDKERPNKKQEMEQLKQNYMAWLIDLDIYPLYPSLLNLLVTDEGDMSIGTEMKTRQTIDHCSLQTVTYVKKQRKS